MANYPEEKGLVKFNIRCATPPPNNLSMPAGQMSLGFSVLNPVIKLKYMGLLVNFLLEIPVPKWSL